MKPISEKLEDCIKGLQGISRPDRKSALGAVSERHIANTKKGHEQACIFIGLLFEQYPTLMSSTFSEHNLNTIKQLGFSLDLDNKSANKPTRRFR